MLQSPPARARQWGDRRPNRGLALASALLTLCLAACSTAPTRDGPPQRVPVDLDRVADALPRIEALRAGGPNKPYEALGRRYVPATSDVSWQERGLASWYGRKYHGRSTASGEPYDMFAMTAAHPTLPIPSYVRVRNPANGREVIVRVNDRGPFVDGRVIDLSYAAAYRLGVLGGVAPVELVRITNAMIASGSWPRAPDAAIASQPAPTPAAGAAIDPLGSMIVERGWVPVAEPRGTP